MSDTYYHVAAKYVHERVRVSFGAYGNGAPAVQLFTEEGELVSVVTVNLGVRPREGCIFVKNYSEGEGMVQGLLQAGIITEVLGSYDVGFAVNGVYECRVAEGLYNEFTGKE
jgi:hypothetical protein